MAAFAAHIRIHAFKTIYNFDGLKDFELTYLPLEHPYHP